MKNVHLLPVEKPSRLIFDKEDNIYLSLQDEPVFMEHQDLCENQNIYITNDAEIEFDDYYLGEDNNLYCLVTKVNSNGKKIILTTDHELIEEGIQAIDDEFLEWFVKNPSCESVEVDKNWNYPLDKRWEYKIIIPKETLSTKLHIGEVVDESYPEAFRKQQTLEEVYEAFKKTDVYINEIKQKQERMYSEIDLEVAFFEGRENSLTFIEWFEQFKEK
jgi:hypothetical protein